MNNTTAEQIRAQYRHAFKYQTDLSNRLTRFHLEWAGVPAGEIARRYSKAGERRGYDPRGHFGSKA